MSQGTWGEEQNYNFSTWRQMSVGGCHPSVVLPMRRSSGSHCTRSWIGRRTVLDKFGEEKITCTRRGSNPELYSSQVVILPANLARPRNKQGINRVTSIQQVSRLSKPQVYFMLNTNNTVIFKNGQVFIGQMSDCKLFKNYAVDSKLKSNTNVLLSNHPLST